MFSVKTPQGTPLGLLTSSSSYFFLQVWIAIKQRWLTLDHWAYPLNNSPKDSGVVKKATGWKKQNEIIVKKLYDPFLRMGFNCCKATAIWGGSLLCNTKFPVIPGTHFIHRPGRDERLSRPRRHPMILNMGLLDGESITLTTGSLRLTLSFPKCCTEKKRAIQYVVQ